MWGAPSGETPVVDSFISSIADLVRNRNGAKLQDFLQIEPPLPPVYHDMIAEMRRQYPQHGYNDNQLITKCESVILATESGSPWSAFPIFLRQYFTFLRDVNVENLLDTYDLLKALLNQCVIALSDSQMGVIVLPTVLYLSKVLAKLAIGLDRRPELVSHLMKEGSGSDEATEKVTLVEKSANVVREAFIKCLTDRSGLAGSQGKPEGKRVGIYLMANLCLKLLFKCGKLRNAEQMFASINAQSPPLAHFPASQRVTYLYYLGRYLFSNNLFFPAQTALQAAYNQCHRQALQQRRLILTYLIPCNIILGRFPSKYLLERPESKGFDDIFLPICRIIASGNLGAFRSYLDFNSPHAEWFARKGVLLQLRNRCEILVWRSLARKVFIFCGFHGDQKAQAQRGPPPFLYLHKLEAAVKWMESLGPNSASQSLFPMKQLPRPSQQPNQPNRPPGSRLFSFPPDREFINPNTASAMSHTSTDYDDYFQPEGYFDQDGRWVQVASPDDLPSDAVADSQDADSLATDALAYLPPTEATEGENHAGAPSLLMRDLESVLASLLTQDLMRGYLTHKNPRFAIPGARVKGLLPTGFPNVWQTIHAKESEDDQVPGWVKPALNPGFGPTAKGFAPSPAEGMGGRVVNLSGARPVGSLES
ncbi:uncharacterized protein PADG_06354 [Paracoccidioides brasiliensis Pb18]|uniref:PCI domain-containing protein n=1 Tax=Paracoccidioides brasiliensis (strain Pb18) TaxID=502780 RepID=C1GGB7_PARBD|nr:uncharacterized protein PADG_06354 [Paracoccidioides brasiliensis Pb18]EEH50275.1 hypothetical protein PADG_06354 [Paracoccidioides brasiliensis Pb18]